MPASSLRLRHLTGGSVQITSLLAESFSKHRGEKCRASNACLTLLQTRLRDRQAWHNTELYTWRWQASHKIKSVFMVRGGQEAFPCPPQSQCNYTYIIVMFTTQSSKIKTEMKLLFSIWQLVVCIPFRVASVWLDKSSPRGNFKSCRVADGMSVINFLKLGVSCFYH